MPALGSYPAVDPPAIVAVTVAVQPHPVDHALVSFLVSFTYVRTRSVQSITNRRHRSRTLLTWPGLSPTDLESVLVQPGNPPRGANLVSLDEFQGRPERHRCTMTVVHAYVAVTDNEWYRFLASRPEVTEVNFWQPSGDHEFRVLAPGEPFFFKTHYPHNKVVGGGFFSDSVRLQVSEAWELFGEANGADSIEQMRARISHYRRAPIGSSEDPMIGCRFVRDVRFFPLDAIADPPPDFARNIVQGKGYDLADESVAGYFGLLLQLLLGGTVVELDFSQSWHRPGPVFGDPRLAPYRLGQRSFQAVVLDAYHRRCAISGTHIPPVLQAAHIRPVTKGGEHRLDNGLLLRSDVHTLFDRGYLAVNPEYRLLVSPRLREDFHNGDQFYARDGQVIELPGHRADRPNRDFLQWHLDEVFKAS
jgi:putative restriction endonuclease